MYVLATIPFLWGISIAQSTNRTGMLSKVSLIQNPCPPVIPNLKFVPMLNLDDALSNRILKCMLAGSQISCSNPLFAEAWLHWLHAAHVAITLFERSVAAGVTILFAISIRCCFCICALLVRCENGPNDGNYNGGAAFNHYYIMNASWLINRANRLRIVVVPWLNKKVLIARSSIVSINTCYPERFACSFAGIVIRGSRISGCLRFPLWQGRVLCRARS